MSLKSWIKALVATRSVVNKPRLYLAGATYQPNGESISQAPKAVEDNQFIRRARDLYPVSSSQGPPSLLNSFKETDETTMLAILRKARLKDKEMRVLMLGLDNAGKTSIVKQLMNEDVLETSPTLGFIIKTIEHKGYRLNIWDVGGQTTLRAYWRNYFEKTDTLIWVVDATDRTRIEDCRRELGMLLLEERLMGASLLVFANKIDIKGCMESDEIRQALQLDAIRTHNWAIFGCSALDGRNLQEGMDWVVEDAKGRFFLY